MKQSHQGVDASEKQWDRVSIEVNQKNKEALFKQHESFGDFQSDTPTKPFSVSCYLCHSNGPRAIRPNWDSKRAPIGLWDSARIHLWNLRIKLYGPLEGFAGKGAGGFKMKNPLFEKVLKVKACARCHNEDFMGRGSLKKHHFLSIRFMLEKGYMPPKGFSLSSKEKSQVLNFLSSF